MRIAYYLHWNMSLESGVLKKLAAQLSAWRQQGADVQIFALTHALPVWSGLSSLPVTALLNGNFLTRDRQARQLIAQMEHWQPDVVYARFGTYYPALEVMFRRFPVVFEINTDDQLENRLAYSAWRVAYHQLTRSRMLKGAAGLVFVTRELAARFAWAGPQTVIANGISLADYPELPVPQNESPHLVFMGHPGIARDLTANWHGLDRLLQMASIFPTWQFDVIGPSAQEVGTVPPNVHLQGYLGSAEYTPLLARSDIGIGTLALERKGMREACPLKVREYLASGLPVITAYQDTDFPDGASFLLNLPLASSDLSAHSGEIQTFVQHWRGARIPRPAIAHLDSTQKETLRLEFLAQFKNH
ncbi:MAG TPA: glycosyltransferase [Anaerolineaceae bacterium]|nr:glycosyltransferase [Anaerolineaceae bacterium]